MDPHDAVLALRDALDIESRRADALAAVAPYLPARGLQLAVDAAREHAEMGYDASAAFNALAMRTVEFDDPWLISRLGETLAPYVPDQALTAFVDLAVALPDAFHEDRSRVVAELAARLAAGGRPEAGLLLLELALRTAPASGWFGDRAAAVASYIREEDDADRLVELVMRELSPDARAATLVALAHWMIDGDLLRQTADEVEDDVTRARLYVAWLHTRPEAERQDLARSLLEQGDRAPLAVAGIALRGVLPEAFDIGLDALLAELGRVEDEPLWPHDAWFWAAIHDALAAPHARGAVAEALLGALPGLSDEWSARAIETIGAQLSYEELTPLVGRAHEAISARPNRRALSALDRWEPRAGGAFEPDPLIREIEATLSDVDPGDRSEVVLAALTSAPRSGSAAQYGPPLDIEELPAAYDRKFPAKPARPERPGGFDEDDLLEDGDFLEEDDLLADDALLEEDVYGPSRGWRGPAHPVVNTGFAEPGDPGRSLHPHIPLQPGTQLFWLQVGEPDPYSIETAPIGLEESVPSGSRVTVALYPVSAGVEIAGAETGELEVLPDGSAIVVRPAAPIADPELVRWRLAFALEIAPGVDEIELRCSIFRTQLLVQSRRIRAAVTDRPPTRGEERVVTSDVDYVLIRELAPAPLRQVAEHGLSLMVNGDAATHNLHALLPGDEAPITHSTRFEGGELQDMIVQARRALRSAAFGSPEPWCAKDKYQYNDPVDRARLEKDLLELAVRGFRFYDACINRLVGGRAASVKFENATLGPTRIQIALKQHGGLILPAALFYDHPLDTGLRHLRLCPAFLDALGDVDAMTALDCFGGQCPDREDVTVVCPSGFWGFRHDLGLPLSIDAFGDGPVDVSFDIGYDSHPDLGVAVSTDPRFELRATHEQQLQGLRPDLGWHYADTRTEVIELMRRTPAQLLYFYCHGGLSAANAPFLSVGGVDEEGITSDVFRTYRIHWDDPRPLVFINGCHTTALEPDTALDFVSRLVDTAAAAGVIGTEITTFEPLAGAFATECLRRFLGGEEIGAAVRGARLTLLASGNPLGLIYIPFVMPSLRLVDRAA
jgi:hypothetical protein